MLGVVLWSDATDRKAVIWCEDQGDLAYVSAQDLEMSPDNFFDAGDLVQFDMHVEHETRHAHNAHLVLEQGGRSLPAALKSASLRQKDEGEDRGEVVPFARPVRETYHAKTGPGINDRRIGR